MTPSPLQLDLYYFTKVSIEANAKFQRTDGLTATGNLPAIEVEYSHDTANPYRWMVALAVRNKPEDIASDPYNYEIKATGFMTVHKTVPEDKMMKLVAANAPALLYSAMREMLGMIASRGPFPMRHLPSVMFTDMQLSKPALTGKGNPKDRLPQTEQKAKA